MKNKTKHQRRRWAWLKHNKPLNFKTKQVKKSKNKKTRKKKSYSGFSEMEPVIITLKDEINFNNVDNLIHMTEKTNNYLQTERKPSFIINHIDINNMSIGGMLYLIGQIDKISKAKNNIGLKYVKKYGVNEKSEKIRFLLYKSGYWNYFNIEQPYNITDIEKKYFLSIQSDTKSNIPSLNEIKKFISENTQFLKDDNFEYKLDDIIKEAMGNSIEHAYPEKFNDPYKEKGKWWICGHYDTIDETLEIVLCDYGVGIRKSLEINLGEQAQRGILNRTKDFMTKDSRLIEIAIDGDLSKYEEYKDRDRGKGLKRFKDFAIAIGHNCELTIASGKGKYKMIYNNQTGKEEIEKEDFSKSIDGMLVKWKIIKVL